MKKEESMIKENLGKGKKERKKQTNKCRERKKKGKER